MEHIFGINWHELFIPNTSLAEVMLRGTVIYLLLFFLMRYMRREAGQIGIADVMNSMEWRRMLICSHHTACIRSGSKTARPP